jgi:hypothetical protein
MARLFSAKRISVHQLRFRLVVFFVCCLGSIGLVIYESIKQTRLAFSGVKTDATVIHVERKPSGAPSITTFRFTTETGAVIELKNPYGPPGWLEVGDVISIVYLPAHPETVAVSGIRGWNFLFITIAITIIGYICLANTLFLYRQEKMLRQSTHLPIEIVSEEDFLKNL